jgi:hypothetical protein
MTDGLIVRPGDVLLVMAPGEQTKETVTAIRAGLMELLPGLAGVVVLGGITGVAAYRPNPTPKTPTGFLSQESSA